ncbi:DUF4288 domain-containing protein [Yinghuangia seranimata]|uniref:DUF4288 domain-containing protein n=1 Tax=Yinghuangia seranimata TaxID=408067 RepID=UPI00248CFDC1|nr:DUF4288 domain-containing protein [Yinghuangia seranimata]MDI2129921.1 DUF4288 domain-containing protein [Yinghuangia seranimata]
MAVYIAVVLTEAVSEAPGREPLFQETFVLLEADDETRAWEKAAVHGRGLETSYANEAGERVTWRLVQVVDVNRVLDERLGDGSELYARHFTDFAAYQAFEPLL